MEDLNSLSNEELKYRLTQFGFPNLPVTSTTRKVLIKKLRNHMENENSKLRRETSYATRYSSDEDLSQSDKPVQKKRSGLARSTIAAMAMQGGRKTAMPPPALTTHPTTSPAMKRNLASQSSSSSASNTSNRSPSVYVSPLIQSSGNSDSDDESDTNADKSPYGRLSAGSSSSRASAGNSSFGSFNGNDSAQSTTKNRLSAFGSGLRNRFLGADDADGKTASQNSSSDASPKSTNGLHSGDDSTAHDFTKRLLSFRSKNLGGIGGGSTGASVSHNTALNSGE